MILRWFLPRRLSVTVALLRLSSFRGSLNDFSVALLGLFTFHSLGNVFGLIGVRMYFGDYYATLRSEYPYPAYRIHFDNGYGASIIRIYRTFEVAVLHNDELCYTTPITDDVIGYLEADTVGKILADIEGLPAK